MSLALERSPDAERDVAVVRAGVFARQVCRRGGRGEVAAVFERSLYVRAGDDFICIGEPAIGNGPTTLIIAARMAEFGLRRGQNAFIGNGRVAVGDVLLDLSNCATWRAPPWPRACADLAAICATIAQRAAAESPADSLARAVFGAIDTPLARLARPRVAKFASWLCVGWAKPAEAFGEGGRAHHPSSRTIVGGHGVASLRLSPPYGAVRDLIGLGYGLTPSGDDFLIGTLATLDALEQTNMHAALGRAVVAAAGRTSPLSASFLRAAAAGYVGENLHTMVAAIVAGDADAAVTAAARISHTSGWDALAGAVVTLYRC
jgi:hypothetical protein